MMATFGHSVHSTETAPNWFDKMGITGFSLLTQDVCAPPQPAPTRVDTRKCKRANCLNGCPPGTVLERMRENAVPTQHNRGWSTIAQPLKFRTALCKHAQSGHCCHGSLCWMAHSEGEKRTVEQNAAESITSSDAVRSFIERELRQRGGVSVPGQVRSFIECEQPQSGGTSLPGQQPFQELDDE